MKRKKIFTPEKLGKHWANDKPLVYKSKKYRVGKMSYGDYFLEPISYKGGETRLHSKRTLWFEKKTIKNRYGVNQIVLEVDD